MSLGRGSRDYLRRHRARPEPEQPGGAIPTAITEEGEAMIELGSRVRDKISGYEGIATARSTFVNGCVSICIEGPLARGSTGVSVRDELWFDEQRIECIGSDLFEPEPSTATAGGPMGPVPPRDGAR